MKFLWVSILFIFSSQSLLATNYYISSGSGKAGNSGLSAQKPKSSIQETANLTKPGDTVFVMNGTYKNDCSSCNVLEITRSGTLKNFIVYTKYPGHTPKLKFNGWAGILVKDGASYIKIIGFDIEGNNSKVTLAQALRQPKSCKNKRGDYDPRFNGNGIAIDALASKRSHHIIIARNTVYNCGGGGISATRADYICVESNLVYNNSWYTIFGTSGISFYQFWNSDNFAGYHNIIRRNQCYNNRNLVPWRELCQISDGNGIIIDDFRNQQNGSKLGVYKGRTLIENNVCWFNGGTGIHAYQSDNVDIINNTAYLNGQTRELQVGQIQAGFSGRIRMINNILVSDKANLINSNYKNTGITYLNNLHYNITTPTRATVWINNSTCVNNINPEFIAPLNKLDANFRLKETSPAINHGHQSVYSLSDFDGENRPKKGPPDIGAYEY